MPQIVPINLGIVYAYLIKGENKSILVDCGFPGQEKMIMRALKKQGIGKGDICLIVVTHGDIDHYGGSARLRELLAAPVIVHKGDVEIIKTGVNRKIHASKIIGNLMKYTALFLTALTKHLYKPYTPDIIMQTDLFPLQGYGCDAYLLHTPGETDGSISLILHDGQIIVGDLIAGTIPHSSTPAYSPFSNNLNQVKKSLHQILSLKPDIIYTGHSRPILVKEHFSRLRKLSE